MDIGRVKKGHFVPDVVETSEINTQSEHQNTEHPANNSTTQNGLISVHGQTWEESDVTTPLNGAIPQTTWQMRGPGGLSISANFAPPDMTQYEFFLWSSTKMYLNGFVKDA